MAEGKLWVVDALNVDGKTKSFGSIIEKIGPEKAIIIDDVRQCEIETCRSQFDRI